MSGVSRVLANARNLRAQGRLAEALDALASPAEFSADLCAARGAIEFALGRFQDAALSFSAAAVTRPGDARTHYNLALCLERAQRWDAAAGAFARALELDPAHSGARLALGACLLRMKRPREALAQFEQVRGKRAGALLGQAAALQLLGRAREAGAAYQQLLALEPASEEPLANWISLSVEADDHERVRELSERLLALAPQSKAALQGLAAAALRDKDHDAAMRYCGRLLESAPDCLEAWHNLRIAIQHASFAAAEPVFAMHHGGNV